LAHLFNAPRVDPLAEGPLEGLGMAGVDYLLGQLHLDKALQRARILTLLMPAGPAGSANLDQTQAALRKQLGWRLERERRELRNTHRYGGKVTVFAFLMLTICLGLSSLFASEMTAWMRPLFRKTLEYGFEIIGWVILWHPIDVLVFSPVSIRARMAALQSLATMNIVIRSDRSPGSKADAAPI
jgi:hypothetical protein